MLKKIVLGGAAAAAFAGLGFVPPAHADKHPVHRKGINIAQQSGNVVVCGNRGIDEVLVLVAPLTPVTPVNRDRVDCGVRKVQY
ncbi:hypothetical protein AB0K60_34125 [Thermopolyspora sp. NPDC052614]|uniref:hypothetical protein n=1 Tax=Thermopolyspora sp. NPDC052614 TaxID=3155682 RepID=UPI00341666D9